MTNKHSLLSGLLFSLVFALLFSACVDPEVDSGPDSNPIGMDCINSVEDGYQTIVQDTTREYILHVPPSYDCESMIPLVINFHGFGDSAEDYESTVGEFYGFNTSANANGFIVAYPQGLEREKEAPEWDPGDNGEADLRTNDVYFTEMLIEDISSEFNVDPARIYATGYSNGGMMSYGLACSKSDMIAAVGIMSGVMLDESCAQNETTAVIHFHGIDDEVLPYNGNMYYQPISDIIDFWVDHNGIDATSLVESSLNDGAVIKEVYDDGISNTSVELYTIKSEYDKPGGHVWFSDEIEGITPNQILWNFLSSYSLDD